VTRVDLSKWDDYTSFDTQQPSSAPISKETHSGSDVAIFANGKAPPLSMYYAIN
jgi:hypothetical protein